MDGVKVIRPGAKVRISNDLTGIVLAAQVGFNDIVWYTVTWWNGRERKEATLAAAEVALLVPAEYDIKRIGFLPAET